MAAKLFGELFKELRQKKGYTLREYCRTFGKDPGYMSKMERGKMSPPIKEIELVSLAHSVGLKENTEAWNNFFSTALISAGRIPQEIMSDEEVLKYLPVLLRTIKGEKLTEDKLDVLIEVIKST